MADLYGPPDIEPAVVALLSVDPVHVGTRYPSGAGSEAAGVIRVSATGGARPTDRVVTESTVLIECWHDDANVAWEIAQRAWARLDAAPESGPHGVDFKHVSSTMPNNNPDVNRPGMVRFQFLSSIHSRTVPLEVS